MAKATGSIVVNANPSADAKTITLDDGQGTIHSQVTLSTLDGNTDADAFDGQNASLYVATTNSTNNATDFLYLRASQGTYNYNAFADDWGIDGDQPALLVFTDTEGTKLRIRFSTSTSGTAGSAVSNAVSSGARKVSSMLYEVNGNTAHAAESGEIMFNIEACLNDAITNDSYKMLVDTRNDSNATPANAYYATHLFITAPDQTNYRGHEHAGLSVGLERNSGTWTSNSRSIFEVAYATSSGTNYRLGTLNSFGDVVYGYRYAEYNGGVPVNTDLSSADLATAIKNLINALPIAITATVSSTTVSLTNDAHGTEGNTTISTNDSTNFSVTSFSGGTAEGGGGGGGGGIVMARTRLDRRLIAVGGIESQNIASGSIEIGHLNFTAAEAGNMPNEGLADADIMAVHNASSDGVFGIKLGELKAYLSSSTPTHFTASGDVILGTPGDGDDIAIYNGFISSLTPKTDNKNDLGASAKQWKDLYINGIAYIDQLGTDADPSAAYISSGEIDGTVIGGESAAAGTFTTLDATTDVTVGSLIITDDQIQMTPSSGDTATIAAASDGALNITTVDAAGTAADLTVTVDGQIELKAADAAGIIMEVGGSDQVVLTDGLFAPATDNDVDLGSVAKSFKNAHIQGTATVGTVTATNMDGILGANTPAAATVTTLSATGDVDLGDATTDTVTFTARVDSDFLPSTDSARDLGSSALQWAEAHIDAGYIDSVTSTGTISGSAVTTHTATADKVVAKDLDATSGTFTGTVSGSAGTFHTLAADILNVEVINSTVRTNTTLEIADKLLISGKGETTDSNLTGGGLQIGGSNGSDVVASILYDDSLNSNVGGFDLNLDGSTFLSLHDAGVVPTSDNEIDLGASGAQYKDLYVNGIGYIDQLGTDADPSAAYISSGEIDGTVIGGESAAAGTFTTLDATTDVTVGSLVITDDQIQMTPSSGDTATIAAASDGALSITTVDAAGTAADLTVTVDGQIELKAADAAGIIMEVGGSDQVVLTDGLFAPATDNDVDLGSVAKSFKNAHIQGAATLGSLTSAGDALVTGSLVAPKMNRDLTDAHGGLVMDGKGKLSVGIQKKVFMRAATGNAIAMSSDYLTASLSAVPQSGSLQVYLNGILLNGMRVDKTGILGKPSGNHMGIDYREFRTNGAGGSPLSSSVFLHPNLVLDSDDILQVIYLSGSDIPVTS